ncbi:MAG: DUF3667 domain-containing protein [Flavobacterium sp.]
MRDNIQDNELIIKKKMDAYKKNKLCKNCDYPLDNCNKFCTNCGQKDLNKKLSILDFIEEFFANFYAFDSKVITSLKYLVTQPGLMAKEYVEGRRLKFVNPFKLLLSLAIILGLIISLTTFLEEIKNTKTQKEIQKELEEEQEELIKIEDTLAIRFNFKRKTVNDQNGIIKKSDTSWLDKKKNIFYTKNHTPKQGEINELKFSKKVQFFNNYADDFPKETYQDFCIKNNYTYKFWDKLIFEKIQILNTENFEDEFNNTLKSNFPYFLFFCLNFFAILMYVFFYRSGYNFTEHLIFVFYLFSFYLLPIIFYVLIEIFYVNDDFTPIYFIILFFYNWIYFYKSLKNFYLQKRIIFIIKFVLLTFIMPIFLGLSIFIVLTLSVLLS